LKTSFLTLLLVSIFFISSISAQTVTGEWYGVGKVKKAGDHNSYLSEMVLKQKGNKVTGELNYFYRSAEIKVKVNGTYNSRYRVLELTPQPMLNFLAKNANGADCPMEGSFTLKTIDGQKVLVGQFNPTYNYRVTCPAIDVRFTRFVPTDDNPTPKLEDVGDSTATAKLTTRSLPDVTLRPAVISKADTAKKPFEKVNSPVNKPVTIEQQSLQALKLRSFDESPVIEVDADSLRVALYDNGEVDNDTISLFYNQHLVASRQMLSDKPLNYTLYLDSGVNEISMFAENLGKIPPNTALAIIYAGEQRFELNLTSTLNKNAVIRFRKKEKKTDAKNIN
jgi:hypothetical protein